MANFSFHSHTDESAVEQILAQAMDHCVLEQVAAINCSSFSNSHLPSNLESRFQRLKTFPSSSSKPLNYSVNSPQLISENPRKNPQKISNSSSGHLNLPNFNPKNDENLGKGKNFAFNKGKDENFTSKKGKGEKGKEEKFISRSLSFGSNSSDSSTKTVKTGCFWFSSKKKKYVEARTRVGELDGDELGKHDKILSDLKTFSEIKQKKLMKLAKKEEKKINKEAEKIVKWAKQASARMEFSGIIDDDDDLSDDDGHKFGLR